MRPGHPWIYPSRMKLKSTSLIAALSVTAAACGQPPETVQRPESQVIATQGMVQFIATEPDLTNDQIKLVVKKHCPGTEWCKLHIWDNTTAAGRSLPMTDAQVESMVADYVRNPNTSYERLLVNGTEVDLAVTKKS